MRRLIVVVFSLLALAGCMAPVLTESGRPLRYPLYFQEWSSKLDDEGMQVVKLAALYANSHPLAEVTVNGFAAPDGPKLDNEILARARAQIVSDTLVANGVAASRIRRDSEGATPFAFSAFESRRVEISVLTH